MIEMIPIAIAVGLVAMAAITDWRTGRIPNWLTVPPLMAAPVAYFAIAGVDGLVFSVVGALVCIACPYVLFRRGAIGGGDVKLLAMIGALVGVMIGLEGQLLGFIIAAVYAIGLRVFGGGLRKLAHNCFFLFSNPVLPAPYKREVARSEMSSLRLGGFILLGLCASVTLRHPELWS
jgi:prepilin peptidase CpaA